MFQRFLLTCGALAAGLAPRAAAQERLAKFTGDDAYDSAGTVAISGDTAVVGAPRAHGSFSSGDGAVYVLRRGSTWPANVGDPGCTEIFTPVSAFTETFGTSVAIDGSLIVAGEPEYQHDLVTYDYGAAFVFYDDGATVTLEATLTPTLTQNSFAGKSVDAFADFVAIGAPGEFLSTTDPGHVYIYRRSPSVPHWGAVDGTLTAPAGSVGDRFGYSVAIHGNICVVGAVSAEAAYAFVRTPAGWFFDGELHPLLAASGFGCAVDFDGSTAIVGASLGDAVLLFRRSAPGNWVQIARLEGVEPTALEGFGDSVAVDGDRVVVGASLRDTVHVFRRAAPGTWSASQRISELYTDSMGVSVALDGEFIVAGAPADDDAGTNAGAVFFFRSPEFADQLGFGAIGACPCGGDDPRAGCANSTGPGALLQVEGSNSIALDDLALHTSRLPALRPCLTFMGDGASISTLGAGLRVVRVGVEGMARLLPASTSNGSGEFVDGPTLAAKYARFASFVSPGESWNFQTWYRDPALATCAANTNLSNAVRVTFVP